MGRKTDTREFKLDAVRLVTEQFYSVSQACKALEIGAGSRYLVNKC
jgi:transposase-like protein